jgi:hypothetical protein
MKYLLLALLALGLASTVEAQPESAYYGLTLGEFDYQEDDFFTGDVLIDDTVSAYRLMVGYQFMEHLTVEGGYGKTGTIRSLVGNVDVQTELKMLTIRLLGVLPFDNGVSLLGGLGYADIKQDFDFANLTTGARQSGDFTSNEPTYYVGAQYDWERFALRLAFEKYDFDAGLIPFGDEPDVSETSVTFFYKL